MRSTATVAGGRPGDLPATVSGGASQGATGAMRIVNLAGEIITDGQPPSGLEPLGGHRVPNFFNGTRIGRNIGEGRERSHPQALEEVVVEDHPDRVTAMMEAQVTLHRQRRKLPDQQNLAEMR